MRHDIQIRRVNTTYKADEFAAWRSGGHAEAAREIQNPLLLRSIQALHLRDDLVFDSLRHNGTNLGKGFPHVKSVQFPPELSGAQPQNGN